jgi:indole-3-glycerol phosphate synthase
MSDFLTAMASASRARVCAAKTQVGEAEIFRRALAQPDPIELRRDASGFDVIAELKRRSPSAGSLAAGASSSVSTLGEAYARGGACAISVVTEPTAFAGSLELLVGMARLGGLPILRKDFLVEPYQVVEARAHGASGVLLIARLLDPALLAEMIAAAVALKMFVLVEAFDAEDLDRAVDAVAGSRGAHLLGVNARDLATLAVDPRRHADLAARVPAGIDLVAESGIATHEDCARVARIGYVAALVGETLMRADDPEAVLCAMIAAARDAAAQREVAR